MNRPIGVNLYVTSDDGVRVELRSRYSRVEIIKLLISAAFREEALLFQPLVRDKLRFVSNLLEKGLVYVKDGEYYFTF